MRTLGFVVLVIVGWLLLRKIAGATGTANYRSGGGVNELTGPSNLTPPAPMNTAIDETGPTMASNPLELMAEAIYQNESGGSPDSLAARNNNPGNLKNLSGSFNQYPDFGSGWNALQDYITRHATQHPDWDFFDFFDWYLRGSTTAPGQDSQGDSDAYADQVAAYMGVDPTQTVSSAIGQGS